MELSSHPSDINVTDQQSCPLAFKFSCHIGLILTDKMVVEVND
jgi:hypothetical protein